MNASINWLRDFVDFDLSPEQLRDLLTSRCATVDEVTRLRQDLAGVVIGRVVEAARHPDSDHLWVTRVDAGKGELSHVVCGAPNVIVGMLYPFAPVGTIFPGGLKLEKRKIRGQLSEGMLCSARELGLGTDHEGILALDIDAPVGTPFLQAVEVGDTRLVIDVLPNRPDLLSHEGIAREIAAATGADLRRPMHPPATLNRAVAQSASAPVGVNVEDKEGAPRYLAIEIRGVTVGPSPKWLSSPIEAVGGRSISNIVDVTNYMLHGFGQPMHAFDLSSLAGGEIVVRRARTGEKITTLDGIDRTLDESMTVIADAEKAAAIAGIIGGKGSEVTSETTDIVLEVAAFDPQRVRASRKKLGLSTDASYRFERGVDASAIPDLARYAAELITRVAGGVASLPPVDVSQSDVEPRLLPVRASRVERVLGESIPTEAIREYLEAVGFRVDDTSDVLQVTPPAFRGDVVGEVEVIEEIARLHGYERFSSEIRPFRPGTVPDAPLRKITEIVRDVLIAAGLLEARPMPFVRAGDDSHRVRNPLADDEAYLRTTILDTLARRVEYNFAHMERNVRLFEVGTVFLVERDGKAGSPPERIRAAAVVTGQRRPPHFTDPHPPIYDEWDARELGESIASAAYPGAAINCAPGVADVLWIVCADGNAIGSVRVLSLDAPVWASPVYGIEVDLDPSVQSNATRFIPVPTMPAMEVDLALVVPDSVTSDQVASTIRSVAGDLLESLVIFDEFRGPGVADGSRSLGWRLTFRHPERTLRDREIQGRTTKVLSTLEEALGIRQRTS